MLLKKLELKNFKCFNDHSIFFDGITIAIGENNAGKSTMVDALRILSLACDRFHSVTIYANNPIWLTKIIPYNTKGINISPKFIDIDLENIFYCYNEPPAIIKAIFDNDVRIEIYINSEFEIYGIIYYQDKILPSRNKAIFYGIPNICVLPQIVPLRKKEELVSEETLKKNKFSKRTSRNFRNSLLANKNNASYKKFEELIDETWGGIKIQALYKADSMGSAIILQLRDKDFVSEIFNMGHGVQMWLQTMWFITLAGDDSIVVLDEPDVYMHADLQRRLIRLLKNRYNQTVIATHSIEIMSEVQPENILIINRKRTESIFAEDYPVIQTALLHMGSVHNINLSRILNNKRYIFIEGDDKEILSIIYDKLFPDSTPPLDHIASVKTGGWGSWDAQKETGKALLKHLKGLKIYYLYDRDYHTDEEVNERFREAQSLQLSMKIWDKKEIENYFIIPEVITRLINKKSDFEIHVAEINQIIEEICEEMKESTFDCLIDQAKKTPKHKKKEYATIKDELKPRFNKKWAKLDGKSSLVEGSVLISKLSGICNGKYGVSLNCIRIALSMTKEEIPKEINMFLSAIKEGVSIYDYYED